MPEDWSRAEVETTVAAYLDMLERELRDEPFNKAASRRRLRPLLNSRSEGAIERKHQNISAVLIELGFPYVDGYKPLPNYQQLLFEVIREGVLDATSLIEATRVRSEQPIPTGFPPINDLLTRLVDRPPPTEPHQQRSAVRDAARPRPLRNYLEVEARNRALGLAGEEFTLRFEAQRLWRAGQKSLADRIEHVSRTRGDSVGYDILSFEATGVERLIEVKTTTFGAYTPFFVSRNEVDVSFDRAEQYYVYRLFDFRNDPRLFLVAGGIGASFVLEATQFAAHL